MTYTIQTPNASESPGAFPSQANANFQRLYDIVNNDHIFNFTSPGAPPNNDGTHRQVTFTNRATPSGLPTGTNSILYAKAVGLASQLFFYNGATDTQITPATVTRWGTASLPANGALTAQIYSATTDFVGFGIAYINGSTDFTSYAFIRSGASISSATLSSVTTIPRLVFASAGALPAAATISIANFSIIPGNLDIVGAVYIIPIT